MDNVRGALTAVEWKAWAADDLTHRPGTRGRAYGDAMLRAPHGRVAFAGTESENRNGHVDGALLAAEVQRLRVVVGQRVVLGGRRFRKIKRSIRKRIIS